MSEKEPEYYTRKLKKHFHKRAIINIRSAGIALVLVALFIPLMVAADLRFRAIGTIFFLGSSLLGSNKKESFTFALILVIILNGLMSVD